MTGDLVADAGRNLLARRGAGVRRAPSEPEGARQGEDGLGHEGEYPQA